MKRSFIRSKLAEIIQNLNEIILCESEETYGIRRLKKCRDDLQRVLNALNKRKKPFNRRALLLRVYRLVDCMHFWITRIK
ncbi:MAG: hypothetical protein ABH952_04295 [Candidatus Omnitrophota bacterium]